MKLNQTLHRLATASLLGLLLGCGPSQAEREAAEKPPAPSADELRLAAHPGYVPTPGSRQECLGRLVFEAPKDMEWGVSKPGRWSGDRFRFTENMHGPQDEVHVGSVRIVVNAPAEWQHLENMRDEVDASKDNAIREYRRGIEADKERVADLAAVLKDPSLNINNEDLTRFPAAIERIQKTILDTEASIAGLERDWQPMDIGLPDSLGYVAGPTFYAFLLRDGRAYQFMDSRADGDPPHEVRKAAFFDLLKHFRTRALYEVPAEPGVCIPYGFIADDGTLYAHAEVSLRYKDRPGVIYSLGSRIVNERGYFGEAPMLTAAARSAGVIGSAVVTGHDAKVIGPRTAKIGALDGWQGGASVNTAPAGQPQIRNYSVYTAYAGYPHSRILPSIRVELRSFLKTPEKLPWRRHEPEEEGALKENPPPIEESLERLDVLLKSIRLRPTTPAMPGMPKEGK